MKKLLLLLVFSASLFASAQMQISRTDFIIIPPTGEDHVLSVHSYLNQPNQQPLYTTPDGVSYAMLGGLSSLDDAFSVSASSTVSFSVPAIQAGSAITGGPRSFSLRSDSHFIRPQVEITASSSFTIDIVDFTGRAIDEIDIRVNSFNRAGSSASAVAFLDLDDLPDVITIRRHHGRGNNVNTLQNGVYILELDVNGDASFTEVTVTSSGISLRSLDLEYPCEQPSNSLTIMGDNCGGGVTISSIDFSVTHAGDYTFHWAEGDSWREYSSDISVLQDGTVIISPAVEISVATDQVPECFTTGSSHDQLDALVRASGHGFHQAGRNAWIDQVGNEIRWDRIEIGETQFVLERNAGSDHTGTRTSYDCLEDLLSAL